MAGRDNDPKLLFSVEGIHAYQIQHGSEQCITTGSPQKLSLLMVPTSSGFADPGSLEANEEQDFYLHLHIPERLDLPMPATTKIYHQPPTSYLIPRWDLGPDSGAFVRIEFPPLNSRRGLAEEIGTWETILAQCTSFLERTPAPVEKARPSPPKVAPAGGASASASAKAREAAGEALPPYNPASYDPGEGYVQGSRSSHAGGRIVLVDEEDGSVVGELSDAYQVVEDSAVKPGSKDPVEISLPSEGAAQISVKPVSDYDEENMHPAYRRSTLVSSATRASRLIVTTSDYVGKMIQSGAESFKQNTKPNEKPMTFDPSTHDHIRRINTFTNSAAGLSASTVGAISKMAQNLGAGVSRRKDGKVRGYDQDGNVVESYKPGVMNKSLMAFNTVVDGIEQAGRNLMDSTSSGVSTVVGHRWGEEAGQVSKKIGGGFKNVGLVYIDVTGVSRRAVLKSVAKGMIVGKVKGGGEVIVGSSGDIKATSATGTGTAGASSASLHSVGVDSKPHDTYGDGASIAGSTKKGSS